MRERLLVISAVRDEEKYLERVVDAMAAQTRPPDCWLIVDDGSTDRTPDIARAAADRLPFCVVLQAPPVVGSSELEVRLSDAAELRAFLFGVEHVGLANFDYVAKLDGDIVLESRWYEVLLDRLRREPWVGIAGGTLYERRGRRSRRLRVPPGHVPGAVKTYRRACLQDVGQLVTRLGWDTVDEVRAVAAGWTVTSYPVPSAEHARPRGAATRPLAGRARYGEAAWLLHQPWWWATLRSFKLTLTGPPGLPPAAFLWGYARAALRREPRIDDPLVIKIGRRRPLPRVPRPRLFGALVPQTPPGSNRVLLVTPARNEIAHLERVGRALAAQTRPPERWVVVDDGSTDGTRDLLARLQSEIAFLTVLDAPADLTRPSKDRLAIAAAPRAFLWGLRQLEHGSFTHIGKLDGDTELPPHYLETLLHRLDSDPRIGIAGGVRVELTDGATRQLDRPGEHVPGALKLYTAECWRSIGGIREMLGWDAVDEVYAHLHGYRTRSFGDLVAIHHRGWGSADGVLRGRRRFGRSLAAAGYPAWWVLIRAFAVAALPPRGISGVAFLAGYGSTRLRSAGSLRDAPYARQLRLDLRRRMRSRANVQVRSALVGHDDGNAPDRATVPPGAMPGDTLVRAHRSEREHRAEKVGHARRW